MRSTDHAEQPVRLRRLAVHAWSTPDPSPIASRIRRELWRRWLPPVLAGTIATVGVLWAIVAIIDANGLMFIGLFVHSPVIVAVITGGLLAGKAGVCLRSRYRTWVETRSLALGQCPSCGYELAGIDPPPGSPTATPPGLTLCPECNARWATDQIARDLDSPREVVVVAPDDAPGADDRDRVPPAKRVGQLPFVAVAQEDEVGAFPRRDHAAIIKLQHDGSRAG